jgi:UDP-glucose 4-epimerase
MVIVFGASGFIGSYLVDALHRQGVQVIAVDTANEGEEHYRRLGVSFLHVDITQEALFSRLPSHGVDAAINLACVQPANVSKKNYSARAYMEVNAMGNLNILEYCRKAMVPKIIIATSHRNTKGLWAKGKKIKEEDGRAPEFTGEYAMFGISESAAEDCVEHYTREYGIQGIVFRLPPVYGYGPHTIIFKNGKRTVTGFQRFIDSAKKGDPIEIWGDPDTARDIIYIKDVVQAFILALGSQKASGLYNISSGVGLSLRRQALETLEIFGTPETAGKLIFRPEKPNSIDPFLYDNSRAKRDFGWSPAYSFKDLLLDYQEEMESRRFDYLVKKREKLLEQGS